MLPLSHLLLGTIYLQHSDLEKAQEHCQSAFLLADEMNIKQALMKTFFLQGEIYQHQEKQDEAQS